MNSQKEIRIFTLSYPDNTATGFLLDYLILQGIKIDGVIFCKNHIKQNWKRLKQKIKMRGYLPALRRIFENMLIRKNQISGILQKHIGQIYMVDNVNSAEVRDILISNQVELLILTATPIIKPIILNIPKLTILNAHTGWLPKYRGLDANYKALRDGQLPGISIHKVVRKLDAGEIYLREQFTINPNNNILKEIDEKELELSGKLLVEAVNLMSRNMLVPIAQNESPGKYEPPLTKNQRNRILRNIKKN